MKIIKTQQYKQSDHLNTYPSVPKSHPAIKDDTQYFGDNKKKDKKKKKLPQLNMEVDDITIQDIRS